MQGPGQNEIAPIRNEFARQLLSILLLPPPSLDVRYSYAGQAEAPDGQAFVIDAIGPDGFSARVFLDKRTHLPLMLSYPGYAPSSSIHVSRRESVSRDEARKGGDRQEKCDDCDRPKGGPAEIQIRLSKYRTVGGILLPHHFVSLANDKVFEEIDIKAYRINPAEITAASFEKK